MKRYLLLITLGMYSVAGWSQKANIQNAHISLKEKNYKQALKEINEAVANPTTKEDPKAWYYRGLIYSEMQNVEEFKAQNPYHEAAASYMEVARLKPGYEKENVNSALIYFAQLYYNESVNAYNNKSYADAIVLAQKAVEIKNLEGGKRFASVKSLDTPISQAMVITAYSAYYSEKYDDAITYLNQLKDNNLEKDPNVYLLLSDVYSKQNKGQQQIAIIEEGRKKFPDNPNIRNEELNYYIKTGQQNVLMKKLEDAVAADPGNAVLQFNLANGYINAAFPKDASGKEAPKPANFAELVTKAEGAYINALKADATNAEYNYNTGVLYYNQASEINTQMNDLGNTPADEKKYVELQAKRDAMFTKALPYFQNSVAKLEPKVSNLSSDDRFTYQSALIALKEIYAKQNNMDKSAEMKKKLEAIQ